MQPGLGDHHIQVSVGVRLIGSGELLVDGAAHEVVAGADQSAHRHARHPRGKLAILDRHHLAVNDVHAGRVPKLAQIEGGGRSAVAEGVHAARIAGLGAAGKALRDAEGLNIADHLGGVDEVVADGRVRKFLARVHVDDVSGGRQKPARLALQRQVLRAELPGGEQGDREKTTHSKLAKGTKFQLLPLQWSAAACLR